MPSCKRCHSTFSNARQLAGHALQCGKRKRYVLDRAPGEAEQAPSIGCSTEEAMDTHYISNHSMDEYDLEGAAGPAPLAEPDVEHEFESDGNEAEEEFDEDVAAYLDATKRFTRFDLFLYKFHLNQGVSLASLQELVYEMQQDYPNLKKVHSPKYVAEVHNRIASSKVVTRTVNVQYRVQKRFAIVRKGNKVPKKKSKKQANRIVHELRSRMVDFRFTDSLPNLVSKLVKSIPVPHFGLKPTDSECLRECTSGSWYHEMYLKACNMRNELVSQGIRDLPEASVLGLMFNVDGTIVERKTQLVPVMLTFSNISLDHKRRSGSIVIASMRPTSLKIPREENVFIDRAYEKRSLNNSHHRILMDEIADWRKQYSETFGGLIPMKLADGSFRLFFVVPHVFILDHPEAYSICQLKGVASSHPCRWCVCPDTEMRDLRLYHPMRSGESMLQAARDEKYSVYPEAPTVTCDDLKTSEGIYGATPIDLLHTFLSNGLIKILIQGMLELIKLNTSGPIGSNFARLQMLDARFSCFPPFSLGGKSIKRFVSGICNNATFTGSENLMILRQLIHCFGTDFGTIMTYQDSVNFMDATLALSDLIDLVFDMDCRWTSLDLQNLDTSIDRVYTTWILAFEKVGLNLNRPKFHCLCHMRACIERHGSLLNLDTCPFEHEHIDVHGLHTSAQRGFGDNDFRMVCKQISDRLVGLRSTTEAAPPVQPKVLKYDVEFCKAYIGVRMSEFEENCIKKTYRGSKERNVALFIHPRLQFESIHTCLARHLEYRSLEDLYMSDEVKSYGGMAKLNLSFSVRLQKEHQIVCKYRFKNNRGQLQNRFDFVKIKTEDKRQPWFGQVFLFLVDSKENGESLVLVRNLVIVKTTTNTYRKVRGMLSLEWQSHDFEAGLNFVPISSIESKVLIVPEFGFNDTERFCLDCRFDPGYKKVIAEQYWEEAQIEEEEYYSNIEEETEDVLNYDDEEGASDNY